MIQSEQPVYQVACLCGAVRFGVQGLLQSIEICHCKQCQRAQGGPLVTVVPATRQQLQWQQGADTLRAFESSPGKRRWFCPECGSPVYSTQDKAPDKVRIRSGLFIDPLPVRPVLRKYCASLPDWFPLDEGVIEQLPAYPEQAPDH